MLAQVSIFMIFIAFECDVRHVDYLWLQTDSAVYFIGHVQAPVPIGIQCESMRCELHTIRNGMWLGASACHRQNGQPSGQRLFCCCCWRWCCAKCTKRAFSFCKQKRLLRLINWIDRYQFFAIQSMRECLCLVYVLCVQPSQRFSRWTAYACPLFLSDWI